MCVAINNMALSRSADNSLLKVWDFFFFFCGLLSVDAERDIQMETVLSNSCSKKKSIYYCKEFAFSYATVFKVIITAPPHLYL